MLSSHLAFMGESLFFNVFFMLRSASSPIESSAATQDSCSDLYD